MYYLVLDELPFGVVLVWATVFASSLEAKQFRDEHDYLSAFSIVPVDDFDKDDYIIVPIK